MWGRVTLFASAYTRIYKKSVTINISFCNFFLCCLTSRPITTFYPKSAGGVWLFLRVTFTLVSDLQVKGQKPGCCVFLKKTTIRKAWPPILWPPILPPELKKVFRSVFRVLIPALFNWLMDDHTPAAVINGSQVFFLCPVKASPGIMNRESTSVGGN